MNEKIEKIINISKKLSELANDNYEVERNNVVRFLNEISKDELNDYILKLKSNNPEKINKFRLSVAENLAKKEISVDDIEAIRKKVASEYQENIFRSWKSYFSLFLPFIYSKKITNDLKEIAIQIIKDLNLLNECTYKIVDFDGANNFGQSTVWIAIYNKKQPKHSTSLQMFININSQGISYGLYKHSSRTNQTLTSVKVQDFSYEEMINDLNEYKDNIIKDVTYIRYWKFSPGTSAEFWDEMFKSGKAAVGWGNHSFVNLTRKKINEILESQTDDKDKNSRAAGILQLLNQAKPGDRILAFKGRSEIIGIGTVSSSLNYSLEEVIPNSGYHNYLGVSWTRLASPISLSKKVIADTFADITNRSEEIENITTIPSTLPLQSQEKFKMHLNQIFYGPPGTGKTFITADKAVEICSEESFSSEKREDLLIEYSKLIDDEKVAFVTFHQSYGYEEFIEGIRPVLVKESIEPEADDIQDFNKDIQYQIKSGVFKEICKRAQNHPNHKYLIIIDEINRGNISKIFGELITLIEDDKRDKLSVILPYSHERFSVPSNLHIIGTMNTADRSLANVDTALRRRFHFEPMMPDLSVIAGLRVGQIEVDRILEKINKRIEALYDREHTIGHAYFTKLKSNLLSENEDAKFKELQVIFRNKIIPLLEEYFFDDWSKIRLVLGDNQKNKEFQFIHENEDSKQWNELFGGYEQNDEYNELKRTYQINPEAFAQPNSYIGIYTKV